MFREQTDAFERARTVQRNLHETDSGADQRIAARHGVSGREPAQNGNDLFPHENVEQWMFFHRNILSSFFFIIAWKFI